MKVSVVIPTWNGEHEVGECLDGVFSQEVDFEFDVLVIDSSSRDRTREVVERYPARLVTIRQSEFDHGDTRNLGAQLTDGELIVFLVQDAYPERKNWLQTLVNNFTDPDVAGVHCRIVPRPNAGPLVQKGVQSDLCFATTRIEQRITDQAAYAAQSPLERRIFVNYNDVASAMRRRAWEQLPYARIQFGEDLLWGKGALEAGFKVVFDPDAAVVHSHEYDPETLRKRTRIDAWLNRAYFDRECMANQRDVFIMTQRVARADDEFIRGLGLPSAQRKKLARQSRWYHFLEFQGFLQGSSTPDRLVTPAAVPKDKLRVLFVVHGFPPESYAGTEVLTLSLARGIASRGHDVTVLYRSGDPAAENYSLHDSSYDGLRTIRLVNHLQFRNIEHTFRDEVVEARFREVLDKLQPDVVHFEHMIHLSATLPRICRERGIASVATLNDFWWRCPKVQLIRPNRKVCTGKQPALGCHACVAEKPGLVPLVRGLSRPLRGALRRLGTTYNRYAAKHPARHKKHLSDAACLARRPQFMLDELAQAEFVFAPSPFMKSKMVEAGFPKERLIVSDYGMETAWLQGYRRSDAGGKLRFGFVGSLVWYKGVETLAKAFQRLADPRAELHIYGDDERQPEFRAIRASASASVTRAGMTFHGRYDPKRLPEVLGAIDVLIVPSIWFENSPLAIHEAFQAGIPVLVSDLGGMRDLVTDGAGGLRFQPGDDVDLARVMQRFLSEPGLAAELVAAAPAVKTVDENAAEMEVKYRQAMGLHAARTPLRAIAATSFVRATGAVEVQGPNVLLRPGEASVEFTFVSDAAFHADLTFEVVHLADEEGVVLGGEVHVNGAHVATIEAEQSVGPARRRTTIVPVEARRGTNRILLRNRIGGPGGGTYHLRVGDLTLLRTHFARRS